MRIIEEQTFTNSNVKGGELEVAQYELCVFNSIDFSSSSFSDLKFVECEFIDCDLSMVRLTESMLQEVKFTRCKMLGLFFETVKPFLFQVNFDSCNLESSSFVGMNIENTLFSNCKLAAVDFSDSNLTGVTFAECDLMNATFENTTLTKTDLRTAQNFSINPILNKVAKAIVSNENLAGFLKGAGLDIRD